MVYLYNDHWDIREACVPRCVDFSGDRLAAYCLQIMLLPKPSASAKSHRPERLVAVVTPIASFPLSAEAEISIGHLRKYLGRFDRYIIGPKSLPKEFSDFVLQPFPIRYFTSRYGYNQLLMTERILSSLLRLRIHSDLSIGLSRICRQSRPVVPERLGICWCALAK